MTTTTERKRFWCNPFRDADLNGRQRWGYAITYDNQTKEERSGFASSAEAIAAGQRREQELNEYYGMG